MTGLKGYFKKFSSIYEFCKSEKRGEDKEVLNFFKMPPTFCALIKTTVRKDSIPHIKELMKNDSDDKVYNMLKNIPSYGINHLLYR